MQNEQARGNRPAEGVIMCQNLCIPLPYILALVGCFQEGTVPEIMNCISIAGLIAVKKDNPSTMLIKAPITLGQ